MRKILLAVLLTGVVVGVAPGVPQPVMPFKVPPLPQATAEPEFVEYKPQGNWEKGTDFYADVLNHSKRKPHYFGDRDTDSHENTHVIDSDITNAHNIANGFKKKATAFYVGKDRAVVVQIPNFKVLDVAPFVPGKLKGSRFRLYLNQQPIQQPTLNDDPLYIWTEWNGYVNGSTVTVEDAEAGKIKGLGSDTVYSNPEFLVYSLAVGLACKKHDPAYYKANDQFKRFLVWQAKRSMEVYRRGYKFKEFAWNLDYIKELKEGDDGKVFREYMVELGLDLKKDVFGE